MCDLDDLIAELRLNQRPLFPANGWRAILGQTYKDGRQVVKELFVVGLMWNDDVKDSNYIDLLVWSGEEARPLIMHQNMPPYFTQWTWAVPPNEDFNLALQAANKCMSDNKADDLEELQKKKAA